MTGGSGLDEEVREGLPELGGVIRAGTWRMGWVSVDCGRGEDMGHPLGQEHKGQLAEVAFSVQGQ